MASHPFQSLRGFAATQPPLFVFTICLMAFGITTVVLAYIVGENEMANPDVTMDWNIFLHRITELDICVEKEVITNNSKIYSRKKLNPLLYTTTEASVISNLTSSGNSSVSLLSRLTAKRPVVDQSKSMSALLPDIAGFGEESQLPSRVSLSVAVTFKLSKKLWKMMTSIGSFSGVVTGRLIGLPGKAADQNLNVTINLPNNAKHKCRKQECKISMCLTFHGSSMLIPQTSHPPTCRPSPFAVSIPLLLLRSEDTELGLVSCSRGTRIVLQYIEDPKLTVMLSYMDRSMVNLHLMHTSYFLFFMVMTLLCCGIIRGRYRSMKSHTSEKVVLDA